MSDYHACKRAWIRRTVAATMSACIMAASACACARIEPADSSEGYATEYALGAHEYAQLLSKEISVVMNELFARAAVARYVADGSFSVESEIANTEESIRKTEEAQNVLLTTMPAKTYETDRQNSVDLVEETLHLFSSYLEALWDNDADRMISLAETMKAYYDALSAEVNPEYE